MDSPPPFRIPGTPDGFFYALAVTCGHYLRGRTENEPACMVLYFSASAGFVPFSWMAIAADGMQLSYHRGDEIIETPEFMILSAYTLEGISPRSWFLYPRKSVDDSAFVDPRARDAYWQARRRLCAILRHVRIGEHVAPLFVADTPAPMFYDKTEENGEIWNTVRDMAAKLSGK